MGSKVQCPACGHMRDTDEMVISLTEEYDGQLICKTCEETIRQEEEAKE